MDSELYYAVTYDKVDVLKELEGRLSVSDQRTPVDSTVLHLACHYGSINCVKEILNTHESLLLKLDSRGETALHLAARGGHYDVVKALINTATSSLLQPENTSSTVIQFLIRSANVEFETALHTAVRSRHNNVVQLLVTQDPKQPHSRNMYDGTPLYLACLRGDAGMTKIILDKCESPSFGGPEGRTALHAAILYIGHELLELLLQKNKDLVKIADDYGWTVFHYMAYYNNHSNVEYLVGVDKSAAYLVNKEYRTALHVAAYQGCVGVLKELVKYVPDSLEILDKYGGNILHVAVANKQKEVIRFILSQGDKTRNKLLIQRDKEGNTPLHLIAKFECHVQELMDLTTLDWDVVNNKNLTPTDLLDINRFEQIVPSRENTKIRRRLVDDLHFRHNWRLWRTVKNPDGKNPDIEKGTTGVVYDPKKGTQEEEEIYNKMINSQLIVVALIATVALTAGFAMPGGFNGNEGPTQGFAILARKTAFRAFMVTDAIALLFSVSALFLYMNTQMYQQTVIFEHVFLGATVLTNLSLVAIVLAFITGTYAVLGHSPALAITISVIPSFFFPLYFYVGYILPSKLF